MASARRNPFVFTTSIRQVPIVLGAVIAAMIAFTPPIVAADATDRIGADPAKLDSAVDQGIEYLREAQADDGSFSAAAGPGITSIVATALIRSGLSPDELMVAQALAYIEQFVQLDGGIYQTGSRYRNYETSLAILCFSEANRDGRYGEFLDDAERFAKDLQWDESEDVAKTGNSYGGAGYGNHSRPDLSNTSFLIEALNAVGRDGDDLALQKALLFVSRCQNLDSEFNTTEFADKVNDGGFYYTPAAGGTSQAGQEANGGLRSYGSMTYAGLKSMIYAGVGPEDPRVQAAYTWIRRHYSVNENPGMGAQGLFYYYHTFAKSLAATGDDLVTDAEGTSHDWRQELAEHLLTLQGEDGSWVNESGRWLEGDSNLVTAYALLALSYCHPPQVEL